MNAKIPEDIPEDKITHLCLHSENIGSYSKSVETIIYFVSLGNEMEGASRYMHVHSFQVTGRGQIFFDGLGGALKNKIHSLIKRSKTSGNVIAGNVSRYISNMEDMHEHWN